MHSKNESEIGVNGLNWEDYRAEIAAKGNLSEDWYILGIDLGTTNSVISYWNNNAKRPGSSSDVSQLAKRCGSGKWSLPSPK